MKTNIILLILLLTSVTAQITLTDLEIPNQKLCKENATLIIRPINENNTIAFISDIKLKIDRKERDYIKSYDYETYNLSIGNLTGNEVNIEVKVTQYGKEVTKEKKLEVINCENELKSKYLNIRSKISNYEMIIRIVLITIAILIIITYLLYNKK